MHLHWLNKQRELTVLNRHHMFYMRRWLIAITSLPWFNPAPVLSVNETDKSDMLSAQGKDWRMALMQRTVSWKSLALMKRQKRRNPWTSDLNGPQVDIAQRYTAVFSLVWYSHQRQCTAWNRDGESAVMSALCFTAARDSYQDWK